MNKKLENALLEIKEQITDFYYKKGYQKGLKSFKNIEKNYQDGYDDGYQDGYDEARSFYKMTESHNDYYDDCF